MKKICLAVIILLFCINPGFCAAPAAKEPAPAKKWITYSPEEKIKIDPPGININPYATFILQGTPDSNKGGDEKLGLSYVLYLEMEKKFSDWGRLFLEFKSGCGQTIMQDLSVFNNVNNNAYDIGGQVRLRKYWIDLYFFNKQLMVETGKFDATKKFAKNKFAYNDDKQFLNQIFNFSPTIEWPPDYTYAIYTLVKPEKMKFLEYEFNYLKGDATSRNIFDHGIFAGQIKLKPEFIFDLDPGQWEGNYQFYSWVNTRNHTKLLASDSQKNWNYGFGFSCDQMLTEAFGVFSRFGWQRPDLIPRSTLNNNGATIEWSWSAGGRISGKYWKREKDLLAFAVGQSIPSHDYELAGNPSSAEGHFETYYRWQLNDHIQISPDLQAIWNPNGVGNSSEGDNDTIFVYALRAHIYF